MVVLMILEFFYHIQKRTNTGDQNIGGLLQFCLLSSKSKEGEEEEEHMSTGREGNQSKMKKK